ncbi:hypothetical protein JCM10450v2_007838 [Rhodotorula kratochvilovae]
MAPPQTVLAAPRASPLPALPSISLLPFSLAHDGPAPLSTFFLPRPYDAPGSSVETTTTHRQAAFRGRRVVSSLLELPSGYMGMVFATTAPLPPSAAADDEEDGDGADKERTDRAAKRARLAAASAAALGAAPPPPPPADDAEDVAAGAGTRRSPRKGTAAASAAARARARAVQAAKEKARKGAKGRRGFALESDEEDAGAGEAPQKDEEEEAEPAALATTAEEPAHAAVATTTEEEAAPVLPEVAPIAAIADEAPTALAPPPAPLRTASMLSVASSSAAALLPSTPRPASPAPIEATSLARDEKRLVPVLTFSAIEVWNADFPVAGGRVDEEDDVGRVVSEWMGVAAKIHAY